MNKLLATVTGHVVVAALLALGGCGRDLPEIVPVEGRVSFAGGPCPAPGMFFFSPLQPAEGMPHRPGTARFDTDGRFAATSYHAGDGLHPGRYRVTIECWKVEPGEAGSAGVSHVPKGYVPGELVVESGHLGVLEIQYDVTAGAE